MAKSKGKGKKPDRHMLECEILQAMRAEGWLAPETEAEVLEAEAEFASEQVKMPTSFDHPRELLHRTDSDRVTHRFQPKIEIAQASENLARAAREGGTISPEVEERMKRDRDAAESKSADR